MLRGTWHTARIQNRNVFKPGVGKKYGNAKNQNYKVERQNYCAGAERFRHTILPSNGMEKK